jgi:hypothetical protein
MQAGGSVTALDVRSVKILPPPAGNTAGHKKLKVPISGRGTCVVSRDKRKMTAAAPEAESSLLP